LWPWPEGEIDHDELGRAAIDRLEAAGFKLSRNGRGRLLELPIRETTRAAEYAYELPMQLDAKKHHEIQFATSA